MRFDLIIRGGAVVLPHGVETTSIGIVDGLVAAVEPELAGTAREEVEAIGLHVLPGVVDAHVHFNEPGRADWEGLASGSAAVAAGGGTCFFDMPLNAAPPTVDGRSFDVKLAAASGQCATDFGLWGGLVPGTLDRLDELGERGVVGFKAFMSDSGIPDFLRVDDGTLLAGMGRAATLGLPMAVHAEDDAIVAARSREARAAGRTGVRDFLQSRPVEAELAAIRRAIAMAQETGCSLHVVHVSSAEGVAAVAEARARGADVTCETCPHYLFLSDEDAERLGAIAKCAPPLRTRDHIEALWSHVAGGAVDLVASDHSPSPPAMKHADDFFDVWGGIAGCQSMLGVMLAEGHIRRGVALHRIARLLAEAPAGRFRIERKGRIATGYHADLVVVDLQSRPEELRPEHLQYRHRISPYVGRPLNGFVRRTIVRGRTVAIDGTPTGTRPGRLVRPVDAEE